jgi:hypothetical protein
MDLPKSVIDSIKEIIYPFTFKHIIYLIIVTAVTTYILDYFLKFKLLKWIYVGTIIVTVASLYKQGNDKAAVEDVFKLARI